MPWARDPGDLIWTATLTAADPMTEPLPVAFLRAGTVQVDGVFGSGVATVALGNVAHRLITVETLRHAELLPLTPMLPVRWLTVATGGASDTTAITVTVVGAR